MWYNYSSEFFTWGSVQSFPRLWDPFPPLSLLSGAQRHLLPLSALARILSRAPTDLPMAAVPSLWSWAHCISLQAWPLSPASERRPCRKKKGKTENQRMERGEQGMGGPSGHLDLTDPKQEGHHSASSTCLQASSLGCPFGNTTGQWAGRGGEGGSHKGCPGILGSGSWPDPSAREQGLLGPMEDAQGPEGDSPGAFSLRDS